LTLCVLGPAAPVTVSVYVPGGIGSGGLAAALRDDPHDVSAKPTPHTSSIAAVAETIRGHRHCIAARALNSSANIAKLITQNIGQRPDGVAAIPPASTVTGDGVVFTDTVAVCFAVPLTVTLVGETTQVEFFGAPAHASETAPLNPPRPPTLTV